MLTHNVDQMEQIWSSVAPSMFVPPTEIEYQRLVAMLDTLTDTVGEDETHPLASLMEIIGVLIEQYEDEHVPEITEV
jgi:HTH-type transcriptional regulator/antitoxin HigA